MRKAGDEREEVVAIAGRSSIADIARDFSCRKQKGSHADPEKSTLIRDLKAPAATELIPRSGSGCWR
jgi:hypothetical protein